MNQDKIDELIEKYPRVIKQLQNNAPGQGATAGQVANLMAEHSLDEDDAWQRVLSTRQTMDELVNNV